jgi:hypothetical protein
MGSARVRAALARNASRNNSHQKSPPEPPSLRVPLRPSLHDSQLPAIGSGNEGGAGRKGSQESTASSSTMSGMQVCVGKCVSA